MSVSSNLPEHYKKMFPVYLRFAVVMIIVALLLGISFQESAKKTPFSEQLPAGIHLETVINLALVHGHAFLIGVLLPLAVIWILYLGNVLGYRAVPEKTLRIGTWLYLPASVIAILLMLYKGYHYQLAVRNGIMNFESIHESLFNGSHALRAALYGLTHTAMAVGIGMIVGSFWKTLKPAKETAPPKEA